MARRRPWTYQAPRPQARPLCPEIRAVVDAIERGEARVAVELRPATKPATFRGMVSTFARRHGLHPMPCRLIQAEPPVFEVCLDPSATPKTIQQQRRSGCRRPGRQTHELRRVTAAVARGRQSVVVELPDDVSRSAFGDSVRRYCRRHGLVPFRIWRAESEPGRVYVVDGFAGGRKSAGG